MAKELPYFKFFSDDWLLGRIMDLPDASKGRFITFCAKYWRRNCEVSEGFYHSNLPKVTRKLLESESIIEVKQGIVSIKFLDEQYSELLDSHMKRVKSGSKGGKAKALAMLQAKPEQSPSIKEVDVEVKVDDVVNNIEIIGSDKAIKLMAKDESLLNAIAQKVPLNYIHRKLPQFPGHCLRMGENGKNLRMHEKHFSGWVQKEWTNLSVSSKKKYR